MTSSIEPSASAALGWAVTSTAAALRARSALETARVAGAARAVVIEAVMALIPSPLVSF